MARNSTLNNTAKFMLTVFGIWPGMSYVLFYRIFWIITMAIVVFCHYRYLLTHVHSADLIDLVDCMCSFLAHIKVITKFCVFWFNQRRFVEILAMMAEDWSECAKSDVVMRETAGKARLSDRIINAIVTLHTASVVAYGTSVVLADVDVTDPTTELPFVNKMEWPFELNTLRMYKSILVAEFLHLILCALAAGITNILLLTLTLHMAGQIDILCYWLINFGSHPNKNDRESNVITTTDIIQKHQRIINFAENIENLYTYIALLQFVSNMIMICLLGFLVVTAIGSPNAVEQIVRSLLFYVITNLEAFIFCFAGEYLKNKSKEIGIAAYKSAWYDLQPKNSRILLFVILRSQKQLTFTAGKMMDLSLESFASIMNASGSYLSMLLAMQ